MRIGRFLVLACCTVAFNSRLAVADEHQGAADDKAAIQKNAEAFVDAFHKADAKALAAFWTPDGDYVLALGNVLKGREAIEKAYAQFFTENPTPKVRIDSESLRFVTPDVAIEDGAAEVVPAEGAPSRRSRYAIVHVKKDGQWLISSVRDFPVAPPSNEMHLAPLEGLVGEWSGDSDKGGEERLLVSWTDNQNFLLATFATTNKNLSLGSATQWIGWDPNDKRIRSWIFDAAGGFGEGAWTAEGKKWLIKINAVLQDGKKASSTIVLEPVDADTLSLQSKDRSVDGQAIPDTKTVTLKRVK